uniref:Cadherin domain-containing protein n=1 Tax=Strix occidentalis caurina TaxID=311401 RepID=A0A8D0KVP4_STROC
MEVSDVNDNAGAVYAQRSFDYEQCREFAVAVRAQDGGAPARSSTATVRVFVLDRNDNAPRVLWPAAGAGAAGPAPFEVVPRSAEAGYLVAKVVAVDADAGRNAWLSYELVQAPEPALFRVGLHSGEVRTARAVSERDAAKQRLVAVVKDHGQPALSVTATLHVVLAESLQEALPELSDRDTVSELTSDLNIILVVALAVVSLLFVCTVILILFLKSRFFSYSEPLKWKMLCTPLTPSSGELGLMPPSPEPSRKCFGSAAATGSSGAPAEPGIAPSERLWLGFVLNPSPKEFLVQWKGVFPLTCLTFPLLTLQMVLSGALRCRRQYSGFPSK